MCREEITRKLESISAFAGVEAFMDTPVKRYSSGMRVRLAFAVAAHLDPEILIIDEVLAVGDAAFQQKCLGKIDEVARSGRTVLFVSHNMAAIQSFCSRVLVIDAGKKTFDGDTIEGVEHYYRSFSDSDTRGQYKRSKPVPAHARAWLASAQIADLPTTKEAEIRCGAPLIFEVEVVTRTPLPGIQLGLGIENTRGTRVCTLHNKCDPSLDLNHDGGRYRFRCETDAIALACGLYHLRIQLESGDELIELIESAISFRVFASDFFDNGGKTVSGVVLIPQRWSIVSQQDAESPCHQPHLPHASVSTT